MSSTMVGRQSAADNAEPAQTGWSFMAEEIMGATDRSRGGVLFKARGWLWEGLSSPCFGARASGGWRRRRRRRRPGDGGRSACEPPCFVAVKLQQLL